jgi:alpha-N-arabinofuranosidase
MAGAVLAPTAAAHAESGDTAASTQPPTVVVQTSRPVVALSPMLTGVNNDQWFDGSHGVWDAARDRPDPDVVAKMRRAGIGIMRYPGGTPAAFFDWSRAVGPQADRGCQTDGRPGNGTPRDSVYGPAEHVELTRAAGGQASIMVPFPKDTPASAAGWVEYMNAPAETNPGGGIAFADRRAADGHPEPLRVGYWEVGNENDRTEQRYWMSSDPARALRQYAFGGSEPQADQRLGRGCDFRPTVASDGSAGQVLTVPYPPVVPESQQVRVAGDAWREIGDLADASGDDHVYTIDDATGRVTFGDGTHGAVPPKGAAVTAGYVSGPHAGFVDYYAAMKAVDPTIDVCATWAPITSDTGLGGETFADVMAAAGHGEDYDCLVVHPYTNFKRDFGSTVEYPRQTHDWHMIGEAQATTVLQHYRLALDAAGRPDAYVTTSELGALFFGGHDARQYRSWNTAMSHATYFASQWTRLADLGVPWAEGNTLVSEAPTGLRAVLGGAPEFVETSEAVVRQALRAFVQNAGHVVAHHVDRNPVVSAEPTALGSSYDALAVTSALGADGRLRVVVVNRDPEHDLTVTVAPASFQHARVATVGRVIGSNDDPNRASFESHNALSHPLEVVLDSVRQDVGHGAFSLAVPKHSVTVVTLDPR